MNPAIIRSEDADLGHSVLENLFVYPGLIRIQRPRRGAIHQSTLVAVIRTGIIERLIIDAVRLTVDVEERGRAAAQIEVAGDLGCGRSNIDRGRVINIAEHVLTVIERAPVAV